MTPRAKPLPADWEQMARLLWLPEPEQLGRDHPGGDTWAPLGLRTTTKTRGLYGGKSHTNVELLPRLSGTRHGRKVVVNPRDPMCPKLM